MVPCCRISVSVAAEPVYVTVNDEGVVELSQMTTLPRSIVVGVTDGLNSVMESTTSTQSVSVHVLSVITKPKRPRWAPVPIHERDMVS